MRASQFITELFNTPRSWTWAFKGSEEAFARFWVEDVPYLFQAYNSPRNPRIWEIEFSVSDGPVKTSKKEYDLTGTGNAALVMSTVVGIMKEFLSEYKDKVDVLKFSADEESRRALYARMMRRLLPDWGHHQQDGDFILKSPAFLAAQSGQKSVFAEARQRTIYESIDPTQRDLIDVAEWLNASPGNIAVDIKQEPVEKFLPQIKEMYSTFDEFPKDAHRTNKIVKLLKQGATSYPVYVEANDNTFVMEGRHRMVAFWLAGMKTLPVAYVTKKEQNESS